MLKLRLYILLFITLACTSGCDFIGTTLIHTHTSKTFFHSLLNQDYNKCISLMDIDTVRREGSADTIKQTLQHFRDFIIKNFGDEPEFSFMRNSKTYDFANGVQERTNNYSTLSIQIEGKHEFGVFLLIFNDNNNKIGNLKVMNIKRPIPNITLFWVFILLTLSVILFNVYALIRVKRSNIKRKALYYALILLFNMPSIGYHAISGFLFRYFSFPAIFGFVGFAKMGYISTYCMFAIPLGAFFSLWMVRRNGRLQLVQEEETDPLEDNISANENNQVINPD